MNLRLVLLALLAGLAIGVLGFLIVKTQSVDSDLHQERLALIRKIDSLDVEFNRTYTQGRFTSLIEGTDERSKITQELGNTLNKIDKGAQALRGLSPAVDKALDTFLDTIDNKLELGFDFEARNVINNQRLVQTVDAVPILADAAVAVVSAAGRERARELASQLKTEVVTFGVTPTPTNAPAIRTVLADLAKFGETQPAPFREALASLQGTAEEVLIDKTDSVEKFKEFLSRPTGPQLQDVEQAYTGWYESEVAVANQYRLLLAAYAIVLLVGLAWLGVRLRRSYRDLDRANDELKDANENLEDQVQVRTKDLSSALKELKSSQAQLIQSEKMASLGQMVAGVAHEMNTPLGYARSNAEIVRKWLGEIRKLHDSQDKALGMLTSANASDEEVAAALAEADEQRQAFNAGEMLDNLHSLLQDTDHGLTQVAELVSSLKDFSRVDRSRTDLVNVNDGIESALKIAQNQLKNKVEVVKQFGQLPQIECSPTQLNQVFLNLFTNAAQAIETTGKLYIRTAAEANGVSVRVIDTGCGMSEEVRKHIFEPFYTTKPVGKGTGLGLTIAFRIVEEHGGRIDVRSMPGKGSEFTIRLPLKQKAKTEAAPEPPKLAAVATA